MTLLIVSFIAGVLTILAPCILPVLPVVVGSAASGRSRLTPYLVVGSLALSIIIFTYLLKASTALIMVPPQFWTYLSGGIFIIFGLMLLFPDLWSRVPGISSLAITSNKLMGEGYNKKNFWGDILVGAALGPIFSTCSPTYFVILASVLPASFFLGTLYLLAYTLGLSLILLLIALLGERFTRQLSGFSDPNNKWKRGLGILFIALGFLIALGYEKKLEVKILDSGYFDVTKIENRLLNLVNSDAEPEGTLPVGGEVRSEVKKEISEEKSVTLVPYKEIKNPAGFVNTNDEPVKIKDWIGEKVILVDFMTYSCINCQRTFPYLVSWYEKYQNQGLVIIGIHTPEFAFEREKENVEKAMKEFGIKYPVVLDNHYDTWNAYGNRYWPRKYLIDIHGNIVYDHIGEGAYKETEMKIKELLTERARLLGIKISEEKTLAASLIPSSDPNAESPETYFGWLRNEYLANPPAGSGEQNFTLPETFKSNSLYLGGVWSIEPESARAVKDSKVIYRYQAQEVYLVASAEVSTEIEVWQDGKMVIAEAGADIKNGIVTIKESKLYKLIKNPAPGVHTLELRVRTGGVNLYAFTFG